MGSLWARSICSELNSYLFRAIEDAKWTHSLELPVNDMFVILDVFACYLRFLTGFSLQNNYDVHHLCC